MATALVTLVRTVIIVSTAIQEGPAAFVGIQIKTAGQTKLQQIKSIHCSNSHLSLQDATLQLKKVHVASALPRAMDIAGSIREN